MQRIGSVDAIAAAHGERAEHGVIEFLADAGQAEYGARFGQPGQRDEIAGRRQRLEAEDDAQAIPPRRPYRVDQGGIGDTRLVGGDIEGDRLGLAIAGDVDQSRIFAPARARKTRRFVGARRNYDEQQAIRKHRLDQHIAEQHGKAGAARIESEQIEQIDPSE